MKRSIALLCAAVLTLAPLPAGASYEYITVPSAITGEAEAPQSEPQRTLSAPGTAYQAHEDMLHTDLQPRDIPGVDDLFLLSIAGILPPGGMVRPDETATLSEVLSFLYQAFRPAETLEKAQAEAAARREEAAGLSQTDARADGYYLLAEADGLLSAAQVDAAFGQDAAEIRTGPVTVENVVTWCVKLAGLSPLQTLHTLTETYDYALMDPANRPYVARAMELGLFVAEERMIRPNHAVTRKELATLLTPFDSYFAGGWTAHSGTVAAISTTRQEDMTIRNIDIQTVDGATDRIALSLPSARTPKEQIANRNADIVVFGRGKAGFSDQLASGDAVRYWVNADGQVMAIRILSHAGADAALTVTEAYRGTLYLYDPAQGLLILRDAERYQDGSWQDAEDVPFTALLLSGRAYLFAQDAAITRDMLNVSCLDKQIVAILGAYQGETTPAVQYMAVQ